MRNLLTRPDGNALIAESERPLPEGAWHGPLGSEAMFQPGARQPTASP